MFQPRAGHFPVLRGKGAEIKHLVGALLAACHEILDSSDDIHKQMLLMLQAARTMEDVLDSHKDLYKLPKDAAATFRKAAYAFVALNSALGKHFHERGVVLFNHTIKFHYVLHLAHVVNYINPGRCSCYMGEDAMHKLKQLVQSCQRGTPPWLVVSKAMKKYCWALGLGLADRVWKI